MKEYVKPTVEIIDFASEKIMEDSFNPGETPNFSVWEELD